MNKTVVANIKTEFEANLIIELLRTNGIEAELKLENDEYVILVLIIDKEKAETLINNYNNVENKKELKKGESLKSSIIKLFLFIAFAVLFYYLVSLLFKFTLKLF